MRVGIIRGDLPGPLFLADLEPSQQTNYPVDPMGQTRYVGRPDLTHVGAALAPAYAAIRGTGDITFPLVVGVLNDTLLLKTDPAALAFTTVSLTNAGYADLTALLVEVNAALALAGVEAEAVAYGTVRMTLRSTAQGPGAYLENDTVVNGSIANTDLGLPDGLAWTVPDAAATIAALLPVGGPLDVSPATVQGLVSPLLSRTEQTAIQDAIAPKFVETDVVVKSFEIGNLAGYLSASYVPDPHRMPAMTAGPAITVVQDDGTTLFTAPLPRISGAVHNTPNAGDITITGVGLAHTERDLTVVEVLDPVTGQKYVLNQALIRQTLTGGTQGVVTPTSIVIPKSLIGGAAGLGAAAGSHVMVRYTSLANTDYGVSANITAASGGLMTLTGLTYMNSTMVGNKLTVSGAAVAGNNGTFFIDSYVSAASVVVRNPNGYGPDGNNGAIRWSVPAPVVFVTT